jgi:penicillin amidase
VDGAWRPLERRVEWYRGPKGELIASDTLYFTHRGPMQRTRGRWLSMRWTVLEGGTELAGFTKGAYARSATEFQNAMASVTQAPAQNLLAADRGGHITIRSTGRFPIRPGDRRGSRLFDGASSASDWTGDLPLAQWPQAADPPQGFLASANQQPMDPGSTSAWFGGSYDPWRALRLNALLRADSSVTVEDMRAFQTDPGSARADFLVPFLLAAAERVAARTGTGVNVTALRESAALLAEWDRRYTTTNQRAVLFEASMRELIQRTWDELQTDPTGGPNTRVATPATAVLARLLADSASAWWDDRGTPEVEDRDLIIAQSLVAALLSTRQRYGAPAAGGWAWSRIRHANINHLLRIRDLSVLELPVQAGPSTLSPSTGNGTHGASWRMVVELGPTLRAWTTYPGGQSGNPSSAHYRDRISGWQAGLLEPALVPATIDALPADRRSATLTLKP